jgi:hypothetical protein
LLCSRWSAGLVVELLSDLQGPREDDDEEDDEDEGPGSDYADGEGDPCPNCGRVYR